MEPRNAAPPGAFKQRAPTELLALARNLRPVDLNKGNMNDFGKLLFIVGLIMAAAGLLLWSGLGRSWLGRLPGDIHYSKGNFSFYFPIVTCLILSLLLTLLLWLFRK